MPRLATTFALILTLAASGRAADYWVAPPPQGSDSNPGTQGQPWATLQRAVNEPVAPGDTVHVTDGTYVGFLSDVDGTAANPITWKAEGSSVVINQPQNPPSYNDDNIRLEDADYNVIDGFEITGAPRAGIASLGDPSNFITGVEIRNCNLHDNTRWGIFDGFAHEVLYENNICSGSQIEHGIYHSNSGDDGIIRNNVVFGNNSAGLHNNGDASLGGDGIVSRMRIEGNVIYQNGSGGGAAINMDGVQDSVIQNNLIYAHSASGIIGYQQDAAEPARNNVIANNTVLMNDSDGRWALKLANGSSGCTVLNNFLYRNHAFRGSIAIDAASLPGFTSDYNVVNDRMSVDGDNTTITLAQWQAQTGQDQNSILIDDNPSTLDSYFVDPSGNDWHLVAGSPAIDSGTASLGGASAPSQDFEGDGRPAGSGYDIGADEYSLGAPTADFSGTPRSGPAPLGVQFTDLSTGTVSSWAWDFGDGGTSSVANPSHTYAAVGAYDVSLTATGPGGSDTELKTGYIVVTGSSPVENFLSGRGRGQPNINDAAIHSLGGVPEANWVAYGAGQWGTLVAASDIDGDGLANALTGPGPGAVYGPQVRAFQPDGSAVAKVNFYAYGTLRFGVNPGGAALDADTPGELLSGAGPGEVFGPHVRGWNFDGAALTAIQKINFFSYATLKFGVNVARGDLDGDAYHEILTGPGPSGVFGPQIRAFNYDGSSLTAMAKVNFNSFASGGYGVNVAAGDVEDDGYDEIVAARGPAPNLSADLVGFDYDGGSISALAGFTVTPFATLYGARAGAGDVDGDGRAELVAGPGEDPAAPATVASYDYDGAGLTPLGAGSFTAFSSSYGVIPTTGVFGY